MDLSNNSSATAKQCWKKFNWRYNEKLTPIKQSSAITLGQIVHEAFDRHYKGEDDQSVLAYIKKTYDEEIASTSPDEQEHLTIGKYTAIGMFGHCPFLKSHFEEVLSEKEFRVKLSRGVYYKGRVDGLVKKDGMWWIRELKTTSQTQRQFGQRASISAQATGYVWALKQLGYDIKGVMYDFIKKPLLRKRVSEDQFEFGARILSDYKLKQEFYYSQIMSYRTDREIKMWEEDAVSLAKEIASKKRTGRYYRDTSACYTFNQECPYKKICFDEKPDSLMLQLYFKRDGKQILEEGGEEDERQDD